MTGISPNNNGGGNCSPEIKIREFLVFSISDLENEVSSDSLLAWSGRFCKETITEEFVPTQLPFSLKFDAAISLLMQRQRANFWLSLRGKRGYRSRGDRQDRTRGQNASVGMAGGGLRAWGSRGTPSWQRGLARALPTDKGPDPVGTLSEADFLVYSEGHLLFCKKSFIYLFSFFIFFL